MSNASTCRRTLIAALLSLSATALGQEARYLDTEVTLDLAKQQTLVRCAVEITSAPHCWYAVYYQYRLDGNTPLKGADGQELKVKWGDLFMPENVPSARWTECRGVYTFADIAAAANLPKSKRTTLWAVCYVWDHANNKWLGTGGWDVRTPLIVTTDDAGKIVKAEAFYTPPLNAAANHATEKVAAKECALDLKRLKLRANTQLYRTVGLRNETYDLLLGADQQALLRGASRGFAFDAIDSPEKALELAELALPKGVIIKTPEQYKAIVASLKKIKRWDPAKFLLVEEPASYGAKVTEEPGLGYRVRLLAAYYHPYLSLGLRDIALYDIAIAPDGRIGQTVTTCIAGPITPYGAPPMWEPEFGWEPTSQPAGGGGPAPRFSETAAVDAYNKALRDALTAEGSETIPAFVRVLDKRTTIPCEQKAQASWFLNDIDRWPDDASK